jgi:hypothetical protein
MSSVRHDLFWKAPKAGAYALCDSSYTRVSGTEKMCRHGYMTQSDRLDDLAVGFSPDNGATWTAFQSLKVVEPLPGGGAMRRHYMPPFVDPVTGRMLIMVNEGKRPADDPIKDGMTQTYLGYCVSLDGGRTLAVQEQVIEEGGTPEKPLRGVTVGRNAVMIGDAGCEPIRTKGGRILVPCQVCPVGPDGKYINLGGGLSYHEAAVLIGRWSQNPSDCRLTWRLSPYVRNDPAKSTRGAVEPTIAQFPDGRILMVLRGSNDVKPELPGHRWYSVSGDEGETWEPVKPWTYDGGESFFSPSSMSQLLPLANGEIWWVGNISERNPRGNGPRWPLVIGRVNPRTLLLERATVRVVDTRREGEWEGMTLSNFHAHQDRVTGEVLVHVSRWRTVKEDWTADALLFRLGLQD